MAQPFKKQIVRYSTPDGQRCSPTTPGAVKRVEESQKYYGLVPQPDGKRKAVPLCPDFKRSQQLHNKLLSDATFREHGIGDPFAEHRKRPLAGHLADYQRELEARDSAPRYVSVVVSRLDGLLEGCGFVFIDDFSASRAADWIADLRRKGRPRIQLPDGQADFRLREVAKLLGIKAESVSPLLRRHRLEATGNGKARRLPRATVEALQDRLCEGASVATTNQYLGHLKSFGRWLVRDRRMAENPFAHLEPGNAAVDRRHDRRELTADELRSLLSAAQSSDRTFRGLTGADRFVLYAVACGTGFRASGLASLTPESFALNDDTPTITLAARRNKSRVLRVQPIPADLAELLRGYLAGRPASEPVWGGTWARDRKGAEMLRMDLDAAGIP